MQQLAKEGAFIYGEHVNRGQVDPNTPQQYSYDSDQQEWEERDEIADWVSQPRTHLKNYPDLPENLEQDGCQYAAPEGELTALASQQGDNGPFDPMNTTGHILADLLADHEDPREPIVRRDLGYRGIGSYAIKLNKHLHEIAGTNQIYRGNRRDWNIPGGVIWTYPHYVTGDQTMTPVVHYVSWTHGIPGRTGSAQYDAAMSPEETQHLLDYFGVHHDVNGPPQQPEQLSRYTDDMMSAYATPNPGTQHLRDLHNALNIVSDGRYPGYDPDAMGELHDLGWTPDKAQSLDEMLRFYPGTEFIPPQDWKEYSDKQLNEIHDEMKGHEGSDAPPEYMDYGHSKRPQFMMKRQQDQVG
jgi:hypothetical protein